jgi:hypothetical protein
MKVSTTTLRSQIKMKTIGVRVSELEQTRLTELALKKGGTVSNTVREIVSDFFTQGDKKEADRAEHHKTRAQLEQTDGLVIQLANDVLELKKSQNQVLEGLKYLGQMLGQMLGQVVAKQEATR